MFSEILCNPDATDVSILSDVGYECFEAFFRAVNAQHGNLLQHKSNYYFRVRDAALVGLDTLWRIALEAPTSPSDSAIAFLIRLHVRVSRQVEPHKHWAGFLKTCMDLINATREAHARKEMGDAAATVTVRRTVDVLSGFLTAAYSAGPHPGLEGVEGAPLTLHVRFEGTADTTPFKFANGNKLSLGSIRKMVARRFKVEQDQVRISSDYGEIMSSRQCDHLSTSELHIPPALRVLVRDSPDIDDGDEPFTNEELMALRQYPLQLLSNNQEYFDQLFELLSVQDTTIVHAVWTLLQELPTNEAIRARIRSLDGVLDLEGAGAGAGAGAETDAGSQAAAAKTVVNWKQLLDGGAVLKLLYALRIIDRAVAPRPDEPAETRAAQLEWCQLFVSHGGLDHLRDILLGCDLTAYLGDTLSKTCLSLQLHILNLFATLPVQAPVAAASTPELGVTLAKRLLAITFAAAEVAHETGKDAGAKPNAFVDPDDLDSDDEDDEAANEVVTVESQIVNGAMRMLAALTEEHASLLPAVYGVPDVRKKLVHALLENNDSATRKAMHIGLGHWCTAITDQLVATANTGGGDGDAIITPRAFLLPELVNRLPGVHAFKANCRDFFVLTQALLRRPRPAPPTPEPAAAAAADDATAGAAKPATPPAPPADGATTAAPTSAAMVTTDQTLGVDLGALTTTLAELIKGHPITEMTASDQDLVLSGHLTVLTAVIQRRVKLKLQAAAQPLSLIEYLFDQCLFADTDPALRGKPAPPKCKHPASRRAALILLAELAQECESNARAVMSLVEPHHKPAETGEDDDDDDPALPWDHSYDSEAPKSWTGYAGLKNLGMICYMNSSMQQFSMVPTFRRAVLEYEDDEVRGRPEHVTSHFVALTLHSGTIKHNFTRRTRVRA